MHKLTGKQITRLMRKHGRLTSRTRSGLPKSVRREHGHGIAEFASATPRVIRLSGDVK